MAGPISSGTGGVMPPVRGNSAKVYEPVGSGSRPTTSRYPIPTSAPMNPRTLGREPGGSLPVTEGGGKAHTPMGKG